jgi:conjugal transfer/entry exclusion protein
MKYNVIDIDPGMNYADGDDVLAVVEAETGAEAIAKAMNIVGADVMKNFDPEGYAEHVLAHVKAVPAQPREIQYDYDNQAWIINGVYQNCNHPASMARQCEASCYGRMHQGEKAPSIH